MIRITEPFLGPEEETNILRVLRSGWISSGREVSALEEEFSEFVGTRHAVACSSGTAALQLAFECLELQNSDEVILPSLTFTSTAAAVIKAHGRCVFADVDGLEMLTLSAEDCCHRISESTRALLFMAFAGYPGTAEEIEDLAIQHGLHLVIDATHAPGCTTSSGRSLAQLGICSAYSFHSTKNMVCGEGGMLVTNEKELSVKARLLRSHGLNKKQEMTDDGSNYDIAMVAGNSRMCELAAAVARAQLCKLPSFNARRIQLTEVYDQVLEKSKLLLPFRDQRSYGVAHLYPIVLPDGSNRKAIRNYLLDVGIETSVHYVSLHTQTPYAGYSIPSKLPITETITIRVLSLPLHPQLTEEQVRFVAVSVLEAIECTS